MPEEKSFNPLNAPKKPLHEEMVRCYGISEVNPLRPIADSLCIIDAKMNWLIDAAKLILTVEQIMEIDAEQK